MIAALLAALCLCGPVSGPYEPAVRLNPPVEVDPCVESRDLVNSLAYEWGNLDPVRIAYRSAAEHCMGWTPDQVARWEAFVVDDVIKEESGGCWNVLRGGRWTGTGCNFTYPTGPFEDAGFFQVTSIWYGPGKYLCATFGFCSRDSIVASPYNSMMAGLRIVQHDGSRPWCYDARARSFHRGCATVPRDFG